MSRNKGELQLDDVTVTLSTEAHCAALCLAVIIPLQDRGSGRRAFFCASLCLETRKSSELCFTGTCRATPLPSGLTEHTQHRSPWWHICQAIPARQLVRGLALLFQSMQGLSLNQHLEQREKKGTQPLCQTPSLSFTPTVLHLWMFTLAYIIYTTSSCASNRRDCQAALPYLWKWPEWGFVS